MLFFDLDGTLIDSSVGVTGCVAWSLAQMGHPALSAETLRGWIGPALRVSYGGLFADPAEIARGQALYHERFNAWGIHQFELFPGIAEAIGALHGAGQRMAVVTAKNEDQARRIIDMLPFGACFEEIIGASADGLRSHKPELIAEALQRTGAAVADCVMIGDRRMDIEGAKHHGMRSVGVLWGFGSEDELRTAGADVLAPSPAGLMALLDRNGASTRRDSQAL